MMPNKNSPHDKLFKFAMTRLPIARDFLARHLSSEIAAEADFTTLKLCNGSFRNHNFKGFETDLLFSMKFSGILGYILFEHLSSPDKKMPLRLLNYTVQIINRHWTNHVTIPPVVPIVLYTGRKKYPYSMDLYNLYGNGQALAKSISGRPTQLVHIWDISEDELQPSQPFGPVGTAFKCIGAEKNKVVKLLAPHLQQIDQIQVSLISRPGST